MNIFNREISIDLMKFLAVFLIINSHMDALILNTPNLLPEEV